MKYSLSKLTILAAAIYCIFMIGCDAGTKNKNDVSTSTNEVRMDRNPTPLTGRGTGMLDTLYIDRSYFKKLDKKTAVFVLYFDLNDTIKLHGWNYEDKNPRSDTPKVKLSAMNRGSRVAYGEGTYFGNLVLQDVKKLQKTIDRNQYVKIVFAPYLSGKHVSYKIFGSKDSLIKELQPMALEPIGEVNPSPPKKIDD